MKNVTLKIEGMSCHHCVARVKKVIDGLTGVNKADVEVGKAVVSYDETKLSEAKIAEAVINAGYKAAIA